ncbi:lipopolysaccharide biosynthesis protein [Erwinia rhapontici]|uniref:lipopolysaccharide biosynthesis protein n=1 Tax=Erwinia rhapontici TaxID=55212 RepID=UPI001438415C|nr:lipopolysaccharide biosynthesis protein [Erwinia rhapontici]NKG30028.1 lipopolysaccharide biosynthesis protein [Erwinia rhapontici]
MSLLSNAKWNALSQFFKIFVQAVNLIYLAKIIPPDQYGIMVMAVVVINLGILLRDLGTSAAIIQKKSLSHDLINSIFWLNVTLGVVLCGVITLLAKPLAMLYGHPELTTILMMLAVTFPLSSCAATHLALLERDSRFKSIARIEVTSALVSVVVAVTMANLGYGVFSLVAQAITLNLMSAVQFWVVSHWRPSVKRLIQLRDIKEIFSFSTHLSLFNLINYFSRNADSFIIGKFMSAAILGQYNLAYRIMLFPLQSLTFVATRSLYPILSKYQDENGKILNTYINTVFVILALTSPLMTIIGFYSFPLIATFFGEQWLKTAEILKWLAPTAIIQSVLSTTGSVFMAKGRTDILMRLGILGAFLQLTAFILGVQFDINTFAKFYLIANVLNFAPVMYCLMKIIGGDISTLFFKTYPIAISVMSMIFFMLLIDHQLPNREIKEISPLILIFFSNLLFYFLCLLAISKGSRKFIYGKVVTRADGFLSTNRHKRSIDK